MNGVHRMENGVFIGTIIQRWNSFNPAGNHIGTKKLQILGGRSQTVISDFNNNSPPADLLCSRTDWRDTSNKAETAWEIALQSLAKPRQALTQV